MPFLKYYLALSNLPFFLFFFSLLITFVEGDEPMWRGYMYALLMLLAATFQTLSMTQHNQRMYIVGMRIRTALISAIYRKVSII